MSLISLLIWLLIIVCILGIVWYVLQQVPLPPPLRIVVVLVIALIAIVLLLQFGTFATGIRVGWLGSGQTLIA